MFLITYPCYYNLVAKYIPININIFRLHCKCIPCMLFSLLDLKLFSILPHKIPILRYRNKIENLVSFYYTGTCLDFFKSVVLDTFERSSWAKQSQHKNEGILSSSIWPCWARRSWPSNRKVLVLCGLRSGWWGCWNKLGWARGNGSKDSPVRRTLQNRAAPEWNHWHFLFWSTDSQDDTDVWFLHSWKMLWAHWPVFPICGLSLKWLSLFVMELTPSK